MTKNVSQPFDPWENRNQHYVPQFWQNKFREAEGKPLYGLFYDQIKEISPKNQMSEDWLYTVFDAQWQPSNKLEKAASIVEGYAASIFHNLSNKSYIPTSIEQSFLREFIAFSACRHPDILTRVPYQTEMLAFLFADAHSMDLIEFQEKLGTKTGVTPVEAELFYKKLKSQTEQQLLEQLEEIQNLSSNNPLLPMQLAIHRDTISAVVSILSNHVITILDSPPGCNFVLSDKPFSEKMYEGFYIPISNKLALAWEHSSAGNNNQWVRREATLEEAYYINIEQAHLSKSVLIGPSKETLKPYITITKKKHEPRKFWSQ